MSYINTLGDEEFYGEVLDSYYLVRLVNFNKPEPTEEGYQEGTWGLTRSNDPDFIFNMDPVEDLTFEVTDDQIEDLSWKAIRSNDAVVDHYEDQLYGSVLEGYQLYTACLRSGYLPEVHGYNLACWLSHHLWQYLEKINWKPKRVSSRGIY